MGQVSLTLNGRTYRLACGEGEEERLLALGNHVRAHMDRLGREFGQVGDDRLLAMTAILITDELFEAREQLARAGLVAASAVAAPTSPPGPMPLAEEAHAAPAPPLPPPQVAARSRAK